MHNIVESYNKIKLNIEKLRTSKAVQIIAISKTFPLEHIKPLIDYGHEHFGENKVQEAITKWKNVKIEKPSLKLHMVGKLQSNKAKNAFQLFDYIHSLDNQKLADIFSKCEKDHGKRIKYFIQVNIGSENQKSGIAISEIDAFYNYCVKEKNLNIVGLMVLPPNDGNSKKYFKIISDLNKSLALPDLSMGMSADYEDAVRNNSTFVRVGSLIFGKRI